MPTNSAPAGKAGRPPFKPTPAMKKRVAVAAGAGMSHEEIALALGICRNTLQKYFEHELSIGAYQRRLDVLNAMYGAAVKGNVAAQKAFVAMVPTAAAPPQEPEKPLGKKEQANADARTAATGTDWADLLPPGVSPLRKTG